jgi:hypothetical protein
MRKALLIAALLIGALMWYGSTLPACDQYGTCHAHAAVVAVQLTAPVHGLPTASAAAGSTGGGTGGGHHFRGLWVAHRLLRVHRPGRLLWRARNPLLPWWLR